MRIKANGLFKQPIIMLAVVLDKWPTLHVVSLRSRVVNNSVDASELLESLYSTSNEETLLTFDVIVLEQVFP